jgi:large subunit ribosomal protein L24
MRRIRREDNILVLIGKDRGKIGAVRKVIPKDKKVIVTGINVVKRHMRPRGPQQPGGIVEREAPISWSNVALVCAACNKPARVGFHLAPDGRKVRFCKRCQANLD